MMSTRFTEEQVLQYAKALKDKEAKQMKLIQEQTKAIDELRKSVSMVNEDLKEKDQVIYLLQERVEEAEEKLRKHVESEAFSAPMNEHEKKIMEIEEKIRKRKEEQEEKRKKHQSGIDALLDL